MRPSINTGLLGKPGSRGQLATPSLVLDLDAFEANLRGMARYCRQHGRALRPHAKTHKSAHIAALQARHGAVGICVATLREAAVMVEAGVRGVLITSPVVGPAKMNALIALLERDPHIMIVIDSPENARQLDNRLRKARRAAGVLLDVDVGMHRTGVPDVRSALSLAQRLATCSRLEFKGVQCYSGMVQHIAGYRERAIVYLSQLTLLESILEGLARRGVRAPIVTGGGTGTFHIDPRAGLFTESQAGSYVFMDVQYNDVQLSQRGALPLRTALFVQSMVLSNNHRRAATLDAGFKSFAMDGPVPKVFSGAPRGTRFQFYGDEFGMLTWSRGVTALPLGAKVELVTPHCDPTVNLHDWYHCVRGDRLVAIWPVDARGSL
ncbi:MAG TPA: DSD1 family PLP-dependent enzyme [Steroidobacteraceae bacterium]|nr:DSD1 family PLP-dependent enzyme [Steroidobacteraceae bacterium]